MPGSRAVGVVTCRLREGYYGSAPPCIASRVSCRRLVVQDVLSSHPPGLPPPASGQASLAGFQCWWFSVPLRLRRGAPLLFVTLGFGSMIIRLILQLIAPGLRARASTGRHPVQLRQFLLGVPAGRLARASPRYGSLRPLRIRPRLPWPCREKEMAPGQPWGGNVIRLHKVAPYRDRRQCSRAWRAWLSAITLMSCHTNSYGFVNPSRSSS